MTLITIQTTTPLTYARISVHIFRLNDQTRPISSTVSSSGMMDRESESVSNPMPWLSRTTMRVMSNVEDDRFSPPSSIEMTSSMSARKQPRAMAYNAIEPMAMIGPLSQAWIRFLIPASVRRAPCA